MADSLLNTVKQGSQLFRESSEAVSSLGAKSQNAGLTQTPSTPLEAAVVGGTPSQSKMAATPAAMQGQAKKIQLPPSLQLATQQRRQQVDKTVTAEQARANQIAQHLSGLGSLGERVPGLIQKAQETQLSGVSVTPQVDQTQLATLNLSTQDQATLTDNLNILKDPKQKDKHGEALVKVSQLTGKDLSKMDPTTLAATVQSYFTKAPAANLNAAVEAASPATVSLGMLGETPAALGYDTWDSLAQDLGISVPAGGSAAAFLKGMTVKELGQVVDTMKRTGYSTQQEWLSVLNNPTSSLQDRQVARTMLTNMGASGVREAEQRTQTLVDQVQAGNTVTVNLTGTPQTMAVEDVLKSDAVKGAIKVLLNPEDPYYKAVAAANPQLLAWVQKNAEALKEQVKGISSEVSAFATQNASNAKILDSFTLDDNTKKVIGKALFGDSWGAVTSKTYDLSGSTLLNNWAQIPAAEQTQITSAIQIIADAGTPEDVLAFLGSNRDALKNLKLDTQAGITQFKNYWSEQKLIRTIGPTTDLKNPNSTIFDLTGESTDKLTQDAATQSALSAIGFTSKSGITLPTTLSGVTALIPAKSPNMSEMLTSGTLPTSLKDKVTGVNAEMDNFAKNNPDPVVQAVGTAILNKHGTLTKDDVLTLSNQPTFKGNPAALRQLGTLTGQSSALKDAILNAATSQVNSILTANGAPNLAGIVQLGRQDASKRATYVAALNKALSSADESIRSVVQLAITQLTGMQAPAPAVSTKEEKKPTPTISGRGQVGRNGATTATATSGRPRPARGG